MCLVSSNGKVFLGLSKATISRLKQIISKQIDDVKAALSDTRFSHPVSFFVSLGKTIDDETLFTTFESELQMLFKKQPYSNYLISSLVGRTKTRQLYFEILKSKAGSSTFDVANSFANSLESIDEDLASLVSDREAFELLIAVLKAADCGAFGSQGLKRTKFASVPHIKRKASSYMNGNKHKACAYIKDELSVDMKADDFVSEYFGENEDA